MKRFIISVMCIGMVGFGSMAISQDVDKGPESIVLKTEKAKKPANFPHFKHQEKMKCDVCHVDLDVKKMASDKEYAHKEGCKVCHKEQKVKSKCKTCHVKKRVVIEGC
jgi:hypothetical protein